MGEQSKRREETANYGSRAILVFWNSNEEALKEGEWTAAGHLSSHSVVVMRVVLWWEHGSDNWKIPGFNFHHCFTFMQWLSSQHCAAAQCLLGRHPKDKRKLTGYYLLILQGWDDLGQVSWTAVSSCYPSFSSSDREDVKLLRTPELIFSLKAKPWWTLPASLV